MALASAGYKPLYNQILKTDEYAVFFMRYYEEDWGYMGMADFASLVSTDDFICEIRQWRKDRYGHQVADHLSEGYKVYGNKDLMNKLWWNFKTKHISFETAKEYFLGIGGKEAI